MSDRKHVSDRQLAHLGLRLVLGLNIALHGASRIGDPIGFASKVSAGFADTLIGSGPAYVYLLALPFFELLVGLGVLLGLKLRWSLALGIGLMGSLSIGTCLKQDWPNAALQLGYAAVYAALLAHLAEARFTLTRVEPRV